MSWILRKATENENGRVETVQEWKGKASDEESRRGVRIEERKSKKPAETVTVFTFLLFYFFDFSILFQSPTPPFGAV